MPTSLVVVCVGVMSSTCFCSQLFSGDSCFLKEYFLTRHFTYIFFWLCWVFLAAHGPFSVVTTEGYSLVVSAKASHCSGFSCCRAWAPESQLSSCGTLGLVALRHVGSFRTRDGTIVPCIYRQILYHRATREAPGFWSFCVLLSIICPNCAGTQLFLVPDSFFVFLLLEESFVQVQALQPRVPGPSLSHQHP